MADFKNKAVDFNSPIQLPKSEEQRQAWLKANKEWWENQPMRYDFTESLSSSEFSQEFYHEIDKRFFEASKDFAPFGTRPFEGIIDYDFIKDKNVLEIGVGTGSHAQLLASNCGAFAGIDLTEYAVRSTSKRMEVFGIKNAIILQMNAEELEFDDNTFDYVWSWGVIHHSANTQQILKEIQRVLKPSGRATIMVYYRGLWFYYVYAGFMHGILKGYYFKERSLHKVAQRAMDGAIARFYKISEWKQVCKNAKLQVNKCRIAGTATDIVILPPGRLKRFIISLIPRPVSRFLTTKLRMGYLLISDVSK